MRRFLLRNAAGEQVGEGIEWADGSLCMNSPGRRNYDGYSDAAEFARLNPGALIDWLDPEKFTEAAAGGWIARYRREGPLFRCALSFEGRPQIEWFTVLRDPELLLPPSVSRHDQRDELAAVWTAAQKAFREAQERAVGERDL
jgi:hypothetical protein